MNLRKVRSFVRREGRLTKSQAYALEHYWAQYGLSISDGLLSFTNKTTVLEIGFGNGESLLTMAQQAPDTDFIGIEVHRPGAGHLLNLAHERGITNLRIYVEDAVEVLQHCVSPNSLDKVQIFFADPWPKKKHHKRRIIQTEFVKQLHSKLKPGGILHLATDWQPYAEWMLEVIEPLAEFENLAGTGQYSDKPESRPETKFELRGKRLGHDVFDLLYRAI